jgi:hypothetical protein
MTETVEGDFIFRDCHNRIMFRFLITDESMIITVPEHQTVFIAAISDARELRDWITRRMRKSRETWN